MSTALFTHPACIGHDNGPSHPESPDRLRAILAALEKPEYKNLLRREAPRATPDDIARVHNHAHVENLLRRVPKEGHTALDPDTSLSPQSGEAALRAAGAVIAAVDAVMAGEVQSRPIQNAFCAVRPPGHHAEQATAMGFCLFNNIAIGAAHALAAHGLKCIALVDFDVHHGNGTEEWAASREEVLFISSHQFPFYPGTGDARQRGALGNLLNLPLPHGAGSELFRRAMQSYALPALERFQPRLIMISAGFDAHKDDPLAGLELETEDFGWITSELARIAARFSQGRIVSTLEGGYDLAALAASAEAHVMALMQAKPA